MNVRASALFVCLAMLGAQAADLPSETDSDWPQFLGPTRDGRSPERGLLGSWGTAGPPILWHRDVGAGYAVPSIVGNRLILFQRLANEEVITCLNASTGDEFWRRSYPSHFIDPYGYNNGPRSAPLIDHGRVYTFGAEGVLTCLDFATGEQKWQVDSARHWEIPPAFFGVGSSPVMEDNRLLVMIGGQPNSGVVALNPEDGKVLWESVGQKNWQGVPITIWPGELRVDWRTSEKQASYATPVIATVHGRKRAFCFTRQGLVALDPANGTVDFSYWFRSKVNDSVNAMSPVVIDGSVLVSSAYYRTGSALLKINPDGKSFSEGWRSQALEIHWNTPIYHDGFLYAFSGRNPPDARFRCVEWKTGAVRWDIDESWEHSVTPPKVYGRGSAILADGRLIVAGESGLLGMFRLNPEKPEEICSAQIPSIKYPNWAAPVLSRKKLYLRSEDQLICFNLAPADH